MRAWLIRLLGVKYCGAFGGITQFGQRWCFKSFGHSDSCSFDNMLNQVTSQPNFDLIMRFKGYK